MGLQMEPSWNHYGTMSVAIVPSFLLYEVALTLLRKDWNLVSASSRYEKKPNPVRCLTHRTPGLRDSVFRHLSTRELVNNGSNPPVPCCCCAETTRKAP